VQEEEEMEEGEEQSKEEFEMAEDEDRVETVTAPKPADVAPPVSIKY